MGSERVWAAICSQLNVEALKMARLSMKNVVFQWSQLTQHCSEVIQSPYEVDSSLKTIPTRFLGDLSPAFPTIPAARRTTCGYPMEWS